MHVGIVGGGYAGQMALVRLRQAGCQVTLVDRSAEWTERTRLHQQVATGRAVTRPFRALTDRAGARFVQGTAVGFSEAGVQLDDGSTVRCDRVLVAAGSVPARRLPGEAAHAFALGDAAERTEMRARLLALPAGATVAVIGTGLTGLELASEIAEAHPHLDVALYGPTPSDFSAGAQAVLTRSLDALGVRRVSTWVEAVEPDGVVVGGRKETAQLVLSAAGMRAPAWLGHAGLPVDAHGRIHVDGALRVVGHPNLYATGDCAATGLRMACATAMPLGCHAASSILWDLEGKPAQPLSFGYRTRFLSLGRKRAVVQLTDADDQPVDRHLGGRLGALAKEAVLYAAAGMASWEARLQTRMFHWFPGSAHALALATSA